MQSAQWVWVWVEAFGCGLRDVGCEGCWGADAWPAAHMLLADNQGMRSCQVHMCVCITATAAVYSALCQRQECHGLYMDCCAMTAAPSVCACAGA